MTELPQAVEPPASWPQPSRWAFVWVVLLAFALLVCFHHPVRGWNVNTRLALVVSVVEFHTFSIDGLHDSPEYFTNDKAFFDGRFYSDKVFGVSLLALPFYWFSYTVGGLFGWIPTAGQVNYLLTLLAVKLPAAFSVGLVWLFGCRLGIRPRASVIIALGCFAGSLWHGYASIFMPYAPGVCACLWGLYLVVFPPGGRLQLGVSLAVGLLTGFALLCDLIFVIAVFQIALVYVGRFAWESGLLNRFFPQKDLSVSTEGNTSWWNILVVLVGGLAFPLIFMAYSTSIFGSPTIPYEYEYLPEFRENMAQGVMGVKSPRLAVAYFLTLHPFRGLFFWSPWILLALWGGAEAIARRKEAKSTVLGLLVCVGFLGYLLFNSGYYMWWGGHGMGPRLMLPAFTFLPLGLFLFMNPDTEKPFVKWRWALILLALVWSIGANLPVSILEPQVPTGGNAQEMLLAVQLSSPVEVPQFVYWRSFFLILLETLKGNPEVRTEPAYQFLVTLVLAGIAGAFFWKSTRKTDPQ